MISAYLLGLSGSLGHCVGMCSGVTLLLQRAGVRGRRGLLLAHLGRVTSYTLLGALAGSAGLLLTGGHASHGDPAMTLPPALRAVQTALTLLAAAFALHMALSLLGLAPAPERRLQFLSRRWGRALQQVQKAGRATPFLLGLLWGLLPCGLVLTALLAAAASASPLEGALTTFLFGAGTWPALLAAGLLTGRAARGQAAVQGRTGPQPAPRWGRQVAAVVVLFFGAQLALRGVAAWGWLPHLDVAGIMIW